MAQTSQKIRFVYGTKSKYTSSAATYANDVYFATDTREIIARGTVFGINPDDSELLEKLASAITSVTWSGGVLKWTAADGTSGQAALFGSTAPKAPGTAAAGSSVQAARADHVHPLQTSVSGNAGTATRLQNTRKIDGVEFSGGLDITHYGTCDTAAGTAAKVVTTTSTFSLMTGAEVTVKFSQTNTLSNPTLNVGNTGAKAIRYNGAAIPASYLKANKVYRFVYDGTYWNLVGDVDTNTTYPAASQSAAGLMSAADKKKLDGIAAGANKTTVDSALSSTSANPVQNKVIKAELDKKVPIGSDGKIASSYLPSYVDDVVEFGEHTGFGTWDSDQIESEGIADGTLVYDSDDGKLYEVYTNQYDTKDKREVTPEAGKIYVSTNSNKTYRWSGSTLVEISKSLALGETGSTAFPGNRGKTLEGEMDSVQAQLCWFQA